MDFFNYYFNLLLPSLCRATDKPNKPNFDLLSLVYEPLLSIAQDQSPVMDPSQGRTSGKNLGGVRRAGSSLQLPGLSSLSERSHRFAIILN